MAATSAIVLLAVLLAGAVDARSLQQTDNGLTLPNGECSALDVLPIQRSHSHNDYEQERPLLGALEAGMCSIEIDYFIVNGTIRVEHDLEDLNDNTPVIEDLYLDPLVEIVTANGGSVYPAGVLLGACESPILLLDAKVYPGVSARQSFDTLHELLSRYQAENPGMFTEWDSEGNTHPGALTALVSGDRPDPEYVAGIERRVLALDGRLANLDNAYDNSVYPLISQGFCCGGGDDVAMEGEDPLNLSQETIGRAIDLVKQAHLQQRIIRFWRTEDVPEVWAQLLSWSVDLVNTDTPADLRPFVFGQASAATEDSDCPSIY